jgi:acyl-coenzyme A thioesterase PaaI-like protein
MPSRLARWLEGNRNVAEDLAAAIRELIGVGVTALAPADTLAEAAAQIRRVAGALRSHVPDGPTARYPRLGSVSGPADVMPFDPVMGPLNPLAPPLAFTVGEAGVTASVAFTTPYEGPPGCVHGGVIAACFDQVLNVANLLAGVPGPTVSLEVRYLKPTPLGTALLFVASPPVVDGRQVRTTGVLRAGETVVAEASGVFVPLPLERVMALTSERR